MQIFFQRKDCPYRRTYFRVARSAEIRERIENIPISESTPICQDSVIRESIPVKGPLTKSTERLERMRKKARQTREREVRTVKSACKINGQYTNTLFPPTSSMISISWRWKKTEFPITI